MNIRRGYHSVTFRLWLWRQHIRPEFIQLSVAAWLRRRGWFVAKLPDHFSAGCSPLEFGVCYIEVYKAANPAPRQKGK